MCDVQKQTKLQDFCPLRRRLIENVQNIFSEAPLPLSLVEEVVEMTAEGDEDKAKSEEAEYPWQVETRKMR